MSPMTTVHILTVVMSLFLCCFSSIIRHELHLSALRSSLTILYNCKDIIQDQVILQSVDPLPLEIVMFLFLCVNGLYPDQPNLLNIQLKPSKGRMVGVEARRPQEGRDNIFREKNTFWLFLKEGRVLVSQGSKPIYAVFSACACCEG